MSKATTRQITAAQNYSKIQDYYMLMKFRLSLMVVISAVFAYLVAAGFSADITTLALLFIGGFAITAASNGINQVLEKEYDGLMERTKNRPLPAERMKTSEAVLFSGLMMVLGAISLALINPLTAFIGMASFMLYAFLYTPLKRYSTISVAIGAVPGALPVLIGVVAHEGTLTTLGITLFLIQFLWQFPHFWAIAYLSFDDYKKAGYKLLPNSEDGNIDKNLGFYSALYSFLIIPTIIWAYFNGVVLSTIVLALVILATLIYTYLGLKLQFKPNRANALRLMFSSFFYLPIVLILYLIG